MKKRLISGLALVAVSAGSIAGQCGMQRYQINGTPLSDGDLVTLTINNTVINQAIDSTSVNADVWPKLLAEEINKTLSADDASAGTRANLSQLNRYLPDFSTNDNIIDVNYPNVALNATLNGQDFSQAFTAQISPIVQSSGEGIIPGWSKHYISSTLYNHLRLSNITDQTVSVKLTLFAQDGSTYNETSESGTQILHNGNNVANSADLFTASGMVLGAHETISVMFNGGAQKYGYGKIEWNAEGCLEHALAGVMIRHAVSGGVAGQTQYAINGGKPF